MVRPLKWKENCTNNTVVTGSTRTRGEWILCGNAIVQLILQEMNITKRTNQVGAIVTVEVNNRTWSNSCLMPRQCVYIDGCWTQLQHYTWYHNEKIFRITLNPGEPKSEFIVQVSCWTGPWLHPYLKDVKPHEVSSHFQVQKYDSPWQCNNLFPGYAI